MPAPGASISSGKPLVGDACQNFVLMVTNYDEISLTGQRRWPLGDTAIATLPISRLLSVEAYPDDGDDIAAVRIHQICPSSPKCQLATEQRDFTFKIVMSSLIHRH